MFYFNINTKLTFSLKDKIVYLYIEIEQNEADKSYIWKQLTLILEVVFLVSNSFQMKI